MVCCAVPGAVRSYALTTVPSFRVYWLTWTVFAAGGLELEPREVVGRDAFGVWVPLLDVAPAVGPADGADTRGCVTVGRGAAVPAAARS